MYPSIRLSNAGISGSWRGGARWGEVVTRLAPSCLSSGNGASQEPSCALLGSQGGVTVLANWSRTKVLPPRGREQPGSGWGQAGSRGGLAAVCRGAHGRPGRHRLSPGRPQEGEQEECPGAECGVLLPHLSLGLSEIVVKRILFFFQREIVGN